MRPATRAHGRGRTTPASAFIALSLALALALALVLTPTAQAIVNIEGQRYSDKPEGFSGAMSLSFSGASGNSERTSISTHARLNWQRQQSSTLFITRYRYGESNQLRSSNKAFGHLRHIFRHTDYRATEVFIQAERNEFTRLSLRTLGGIGLRLTVHDNKKGQSHLGLGGFRSSERLDERSGLSDSGTEKLWRANTYLTIAYALTDQLNINSTSYYQPATDDRHNYRLLEQASLKLAINDHLAFKVSLDISHDSQPPQTIDTTDISYHTGLEYRF